MLHGHAHSWICHQRLGVALRDPGDLKRRPAKRAGRRENIVVLRFDSHALRIRLLQHFHPHVTSGVSWTVT